MRYKIHIFIFFLSVISLITSGSFGAPSKNSKKRGLSLQGEAGIPTINIENPDGTMAYYKGVGVQGRGILPFVDLPMFSMNLVGSAKYLDLTNTGNNAQQKEVANLIGGGPGLSVMLWKLFAGIDYHLMYGRHYAVGSISRELNYNFTATQTYYGLQYEFGALIVGASMSSYTASIPKENSGLSVNSNFKEQVYWLHFRYSSGFTFVELLKTLFKP